MLLANAVSRMNLSQRRLFTVRMTARLPPGATSWMLLGLTRRSHTSAALSARLAPSWERLSCGVSRSRSSGRLKFDVQIAA